MTDDSVIEENKKLRAELEEFRQREVNDLRKRVAEAEAQVEHFRAEAQRNADIGRQLSNEYEKRIVELTTKLEAYEQRNLDAARNNGVRKVG